jgi:hypothetical protein
MNLSFGCVDLIVTPSGEYVFLEVNQVGQFLFVEHYTSQCLLDMFAEFLIQARLDFSWNEDAASIRLADVRAEAETRARQAKRVHVPSPLPATVEERAEA